MANNTNTKVANPCRILTKPGILSYAFIFDPAPQPKNSKQQADSNDKYSTHLLIPKDDAAALAQIKAAMMAAVNQGIQDPKVWGGKKPAQIAYPIHDGDEVADKKGEVYRGHFFLTASNFNRPKVKDADGQDLFDRDEIYSGIIARLVVQFKPYNFNNANKGITCRLLGVMKIEDGTPLGGSIASDEDFIDLSEEDDGDLPFTLPGETEEEARAAMQQQRQQAAPAPQQQAPQQKKTDMDALLGDMLGGKEDFAA